MKTINNVNAVNGGCFDWCACFCPKRVVYIDSFCQNAKIIYVSSKDVLTDAATRAIFEHNELWTRLCTKDDTKIL